jgi:hypothetical protein
MFIVVKMTIHHAEILTSHATLKEAKKLADMFFDTNPEICHLQDFENENTLHGPDENMNVIVKNHVYTVDYRHTEFDRDRCNENNVYFHHCTLFVVKIPDNVPI